MKKIIYILSILIIVSSCSKHIKSITNKEIKTEIDQVATLDSAVSTNSIKSTNRDISFKYFNLFIDKSGKSISPEEMQKLVKEATGTDIPASQFESSKPNTNDQAKQDDKTESNNSGLVISGLIIDIHESNKDTTSSQASINKNTNTSTSIDSDESTKITEKKSNSIKSYLIIALIIIIFVFLIVIKIKGAKVSGIFKKIFGKKAA